MIFEEKQKSQPIEKRQVWEAFQKVKKNGGAAGVDKLSIETVSAQARRYLYPIWNRLASGSYYPQPVREVEIPKDDGRKRKLGIPTVVDRTAQMVIREELEAIVDKQFSESSYGYRPKKSAHQAIEKCKENCMKMNWVIDLDIKSFFDEIDHELMMKALSHFTDKKHIHLYVKRWLEASVQKKDGTIQKRSKGTPQGGVISPLLANIFLHIVFDKWIEKNHPDVKFERYADDIVIHCSNFKEALRTLEAVKARLKQCKLEIKDGKSNIVYCKRNQKVHPKFKVHYVQFDFLGFTFKPRMVKGWFGHFHLGFTPSISRKSQKKISQTLAKLKLHRMVHLELQDLSVIVAEKIRGWIYYYGKTRMSELHYVFRFLNKRLARWVRNKYREYRKKHWFFAYKHLQDIAKQFPNMFVHWEYGFLP
jgi:RNA-directed DNA polymerase